MGYGSDRSDRNDRNDRNERSDRNDRPRRRFRTRTRRKKSCGEVTFDYKRPETLRPFVTSHGRIKPVRITGMCTKHQRLLAREIKRSRHLAMLPFVTD